MQPHRWQPTRFPCPWDSPGKNTGVGCHFLLQGMKVKSQSEVAQSCPTLSDPMDCSLQCSSVHGIFQARVLEWVAFAFSDKILESKAPYSRWLSHSRCSIFVEWIILSRNQHLCFSAQVWFLKMLPCLGFSVWCWWWTGRPGVLRFMGSQRVGHNWVTELNWRRHQTHTELLEMKNIYNIWIKNTVEGINSRLVSLNMWW